MSCSHKLPLRVVRHGRADYACAQCGEDLSLTVFLLIEAGVDAQDITIVPPSEPSASHKQPVDTPAH